MKNIIKCLCLAFSLMLSMASCRDDAETPDRGPVTHPQEEVKGVYFGQWSRQQEGKDEISYASGTLEFTPAENNYVTNVIVKCSEFNIDMASVANIAPGGVGYMFSNVNKDGNGFGAIFYGTVDKSDMSVNISYKKTVKINPIKSATYVYTFNGIRE